MEIGQQIKKYRDQLHLSQEQLADKIYVTRQTISNWENAKTYPDIISIIKLSDLYQISLDELLKGDDKMIEHLNESTNIVSSNKNIKEVRGIGHSQNIEPFMEEVLPESREEKYYDYSDLKEIDEAAEEYLMAA